MELIIPPTFQVAALKYKIVASDRLLEKLHDRAQLSIKEQTVTIPKTLLTTESKFVELLHETLHIIEDIGEMEHDEKFVTLTSNLLAQFLFSLGIEPDFSQIPEEKHYTETRGK